MNKRLSFFLTTLFLTVSAAYSQIGGSSTYEFLNLPTSARISSLGGTFIAVKDNDINLGFQNPSLLNSTMSNHLAFNAVNYLSDIKYGYAGYAHDFKNAGTYNIGVQYISYGDFQRADAASNILGNFTASEINTTIGWGKQLNHMETFGFSSKLDSLVTIGANAKLIYSSFDTYNSLGLAADLATTLYKKKNRFTAALVIKNIGKQIKPYREGNEEELPFEVQFGISKRLAKAPLRFSITARHLQQYDLTYSDPSKVTVDPFNNEPLEKEDGFLDKTVVHLDKIMRHIVIGGELLFTPNFNVRVGFDYRRRAELVIESRSSVVGFSGGVGLRISKFQLSYGIAFYHLAGSSNNFSLTTNLSDFWVKKN